MILPDGIRGIPVVRSEVIYARVTSVMDLVLCATHHHAVVMTQATLCDLSHDLRGSLVAARTMTMKSAFSGRVLHL